MKKINHLEEQNEIYKKELKKDKYPDGSFVYVVNYSNKKINVYRIGITTDIKKRKASYDTHSIFKKEFVIIKKVNCPLKFETCLRSMLYDYRIKNGKDFFECDLNTIKKAFRECEKSLKCMSQNGGGYNIIELEIIKTKNLIKELELKIKKCNDKLVNIKKLFELKTIKNSKKK